MGRFKSKTIQAIRCDCERQETFPFHYEIREGSEDRTISEVVKECPLCRKVDVTFTVQGELKPVALYRRFRS